VPKKVNRLANELLKLGLHGELGLAELAELVEISTTHAGRDVVALESIGMVTLRTEDDARGRNPGRPRLLVSLSDDGTKAVKQIGGGFVPLKLAVL